MGRGKVEMRRIENRVNRQVTFSKRRKGLLKKAQELAVLCDVQLGVVIFSENDKMYEYSNPPCSLSALIQRYEATINPQLQEEAHYDYQYQKMLVEIARLTQEKEILESSLKAEPDLSSMAMDELCEFEHHLWSALSKVRARKHELMSQLLDDLQLKVENGHDAAAGVEVEGSSPAPSPGSPFPMEPVAASSTALQLWPQPDSVGASPPMCGSRTRASPGRGLQL